MRVLAAYCGVGGDSAGYADAGHDVTGVDIADQPDYPYDFIRADAIDYIREHGHEYDLIHAGPPCQFYSQLGNFRYYDNEHPDLIGKTRAVLAASGKPYVIENVPGAPVRHDLKLCGVMFGLAVFRHRYFELHGLTVDQPYHRAHIGRVSDTGPYYAVYGNGGKRGIMIEDWQKAMGIDWTVNRQSIANAIPPAYTFHIATHMEMVTL